MPAPSPLTEKSDLVSFSVLAGGAKIPDSCEVTRIEVDSAANRIPIATVTLRDGSAAEEDFPISGSETFVPGEELEIRAGYHGSDETIFKGVVLRQRLRAGGDDGKGSSLTVVAKDKAVKMTLGRRDATYSNALDSDVIQELIERSGLEAEVDSTEGELEQLVQFYATDWDFMLTRAEANGLIALVADSKVSLKAPDPGQEPVLTLTQQSVLSFDMEVDAGTQLGEIKASSWDAKTQAIIDGSTSTTDFYGLGNLQTPELANVAAPSDFGLQTSAAVSEERLEAWAKAAATKSEMAKIRGKMVFQGSSLAKPGVVVTVAGLGARFDGSAFVSGVKHTIADGTWRTEIQTGLSADWFATRPDVVAPAAAGLLPGAFGLVIGKVKSIVDDPDEEFRVKIEIPVLGEEAEVWARRSTYYATSGAGSFFYPEVDDEVVVGFLSGDPRSPVILGSLYSSSLSPALTPEDGNPKKAIVSKNQIMIELDDEKKVLTLTTPKSNQMVFSDEDESITISDQNGNSIKMSSEGIELNSASSVTINAQTEIQASADSTVTINGQQGITASGLSISLSADTELTASGDASASFSSSGELSINGSLVMIN